MNYRWRKFIKTTKNEGKECCWKCGKFVDSSEFDYDEDMCMYCLFPETSATKPAEMDYSYGYPKNKTYISKLLEEYESLPDKETSWRAEAKQVGIKLDDKKPKRKYKKSGKYTEENRKKQKKSKKRRKKKAPKPKTL